jgi:protein-S-isoprenylcysteine O-methyltransferase Ste14
MYVGVLLGVWATPRMTVGHLLLATGLTLYVLVAMRYEERDLMRRFGGSYLRWRENG